MSDQVTLPPGIADSGKLHTRWFRSPTITTLEIIEEAQRDAVMAERRHVASAAALQQLINRRVETINAVAKSKMGFGERLRGLLAEFNAPDGSNTPDFVLAGYLQRCLENWNATNRARAKQGPFPLPGEVMPTFCTCHYTTRTIEWGGTTFCAQCQKPIRLPSV